MHKRDLCRHAVAGPELFMGWVDPQVRLGRNFAVFDTVGWVEYDKSTTVHFLMITQHTFAYQLSCSIGSKGKGQEACYSATYMSQTRDQQRFTISEVAAD